MSVGQLSTAGYIDAVYGHGLHVVVLYCEDSSGLWRRALTEISSVAGRFHDSRNVHIWGCCIATREDAENVQVVKLPQTRFFLNGSECHSEVGVMSEQQVLAKIFAIEDR